jgi:DNA polymerase III subunit gamma/tau
MMATTELDKIPETVRSRSQVYELRTIGSKVIADHLRRIVDAEAITIDDASLQLLARDADGSMRDAQSKLDQVIAFTGRTVTIEDIATVLGLVGRDLLLDTVQAVADEDAPAAFALAGRAVEMGYDLRLVCRELSRVTRDLLVLNVDPARAADPEIAGDGERDRVVALSARFSREDLLRAFDLLTRAEADIRGAAQPRYHLEMALLRWIHLRKLTPIEDLIAGAGAASAAPRLPASAPPPARVVSPPIAAPLGPSDRMGPKPVRSAAPPPHGASGSSRSPVPVASPPPTHEKTPAPATVASSAAAPAAGAAFKDAFLAEVRKTKAVFYNMVVAQAQTIEVSVDRVTFTFSAGQRALCETFEQHRSWLESTAEKVAGRRIAVTAERADAVGAAAAVAEPLDPAAIKKSALREQALADAGVQAMLDVFPAEIRDVEEM